MGDSVSELWLINFIQDLFVSQGAGATDSLCFYGGDGAYADLFDSRGTAITPANLPRPPSPLSTMLSIAALGLLPPCPLGGSSGGGKAF